MEHSRYPNLPRRSTRATIAALFLLLIASAATSSAQTPVYVGAAGFGSVGADPANALARDAAGNLYVTGIFRGTIDFDPGPGTATLTCTSDTTPPGGNVFVASYDALGSYRWAFQLGSAGWNEGRSIAVDAGGNVVVTGMLGGTADFDPGPATATRGTAGSSAFVAKYTTTGNHVWSFALAGYCQGHDVALDTDGSVVVAGRFSNTVDFNPGTGKANLTSTRLAAGNYPFDAFVAKYTSAGAYQWAFKAGGTGDDVATSVALDATGNVFVTGFFLGTADFNPSSATTNLTASGNGDAFVARYGRTGTFSWAFRLGSANTTHGDEGTAIAIDPNGGLVVVGHFSGAADFDPGAGTAVMTATSTRDIFLARYSATGAYAWAFSPAEGFASAASIEPDGDLLVAGSHTSANDFDPGSSVYSLPVSASGGGGFVARYASTGALRWAFPLTSAFGVATGRSIVGDGAGRIDIAGSFTGTVDVDPSDATVELAAVGSTDAFVATYATPTLPKPLGRERRGSFGAPDIR